MMALEQLQGHGLQRPCGSRDLLEDIDAVSVLLDHALQAPDLTLDAPQSLSDGLLVVAVAARRTVSSMVVKYTPRVYPAGAG